MVAIVRISKEGFLLQIKEMTNSYENIEYDSIKNEL